MRYPASEKLEGWRKLEAPSEASALCFEEAGGIEWALEDSRAFALAARPPRVASPKWSQRRPEWSARWRGQWQLRTATDHYLPAPPAASPLRQPAILRLLGSRRID